MTTINEDNDLAKDSIKALLKVTDRYNFFITRFR